MGHRGDLPTGVHWTRRNDRGSQPYWYCVASCRTSKLGEQRQKWFAVTKYGEQGALSKAIEARMKMLKEDKQRSGGNKLMKIYYRLDCVGDYDIVLERDRENNIVITKTEPDQVHDMFFTEAEAEDLVNALQKILKE